MPLQVIVIFRYLTDKDVFEAFYKTHLQKRLLHGKSSSDDWERTMIAKLKFGPRKMGPRFPGA